VIIRLRVVSKGSKKNSPALGLYAPFIDRNDGGAPGNLLIVGKLSVLRKEIPGHVTHAVDSRLNCDLRPFGPSVCRYAEAA